MEKLACRLFPVYFHTPGNIYWLHFFCFNSEYLYTPFLFPNVMPGIEKQTRQKAPIQAICVCVCVCIHIYIHTHAHISGVTSLSGVSLSPPKRS